MLRDCGARLPSAGYSEAWFTRFDNSSALSFSL